MIDRKSNALENPDYEIKCVFMRLLCASEVPPTLWMSVNYSCSSGHFKHRHKTDLCATANNQVKYSTISHEPLGRVEVTCNGFAPASEYIG